jgi:hypothetical protein
MTPKFGKQTRRKDYIPFEVELDKCYRGEIERTYDGKKHTYEIDWLEYQDDIGDWYKPDVNSAYPFWIDDTLIKYAEKYGIDTDAKQNSDN